MKRLTPTDINSVCYDPWELCALDRVCKRDCFKPEPCKIPKIIYRLADYENTGLEPEKIKARIAEINQLKYEIAVLRKKLKRKERKRKSQIPLSLKQLKEVDGGVWICYPQQTFGKIRFEEPLSCSRYNFPLSEYGKSWIAYRNKPRGAV